MIYNVLHPYLIAYFFNDETFLLVFDVDNKKWYGHLVFDFQYVNRLRKERLNLLGLDFFVMHSCPRWYLYTLWTYIRPWSLTWFTWTSAPGKGDSKFWKPSVSTFMLNFGGCISTDNGNVSQLFQLFPTDHKEFSPWFSIIRFGFSRPKLFPGCDQHNLEKCPLHIPNIV